MRRAQGFVVSLLAVALASGAPAAAAPTSGASAAAKARYPAEYRYFSIVYRRRNPTESAERLDAVFTALADEYATVRKTSPKVTLGAMISIMLYESAGHERYFNTRDTENSFKSRLDHATPFADQPLARYSYQLGVVPIHTSNLRPCMAGTEPARLKFDDLVARKGLAPTAAEIESVRPEFAVACQAAIKTHIDGRPEAADYFILNAHRIFRIPANAAGSAPPPPRPFPFFDPSITAPIFFRALEATPGLTDSTAICVWGGNDTSYCDPTKKQAEILGPWLRYRRAAKPK